MRRSASATARSVCARICASMPFGFSTRPPVSMTTKGIGPTRPKPYWRSRVSPGTSATMASRVPVSTLNRVDLPTLGRPTRATMGSMWLLLVLFARRDTVCPDATVVIHHDDLVALGDRRVADALPAASYPGDDCSGALVQEMNVPLEVGRHHRIIAHRHGRESAELECRLPPDDGTVGAI